MYTGLEENEYNNGKAAMPNGKQLKPL